VIVTFVVEDDGNISNIKTVYFKSENEISEEAKNALIEESERVVSNMPNWTPGKQNGENVAVNFTLPITYMPTSPKEAKKTEANTASDSEK
jgi:protein TonB